jgi:three-Cys-motif partner protein
MSVDSRNYQGRGPALVKHTFIERYLPTLIAKISSRYDEFAYVDLFAGPWEERTSDFSDTAFGIAFEAMRGAKATWAKNGRTVKMIAHLVDTNPEAISKQKLLSERYPDIEVHRHHGKAEDKQAEILRALRPDVFSFVYIDPKGVPDIRRFRKFIERPNSEVFLNFMFEFANRFAGTERMPTLEWLTEFDGSDQFRQQISELSGAAREAALTDRARKTLAKMGKFRFSPAITVDEEEVDRCLYKLIFLSRHPMGIKVFRDAQRVALETQAANRTAKKSALTAAKTGMDDLFAFVEPINQSERSAQTILRGNKAGLARALELVEASGVHGIKWGDLWPAVLEEIDITQSDLGKAIAEARKDGRLLIPDWGDRMRVPRDDYSLYPA